MTVLNIIKPYQSEIEDLISKELLSFSPKTPLVDACEYALMNGGKRFRPAIILMIAEALGKKQQALPVCLAVEFFHTASLIADDLPCMDDDAMRRNKPSLHVAFNETTALLATYALISAGYQKIHDNALLLKNLGVPNAEQIGLLALGNATFNTGIHGATGGQYLDIFPGQITENRLREIIHKKTITLFEIAFVAGWLFAEGDVQKLELVKKAASHFGMAFQIVDDFLDIRQDQDNQRLINYPNLLGVEKASQVLVHEIDQLKYLLNQLKLDSSPLSALVQFLESSSLHFC